MLIITTMSAEGPNESAPKEYLNKCLEYDFYVNQSFVSLNRVRFYIRNQKAHHEKQSFADEYRAFLNRHCIAYDPKYILD